MIKVSVLKEWLASIEDESNVAIDEGGLSLVLVGTCQAYIEIGGETGEEKDFEGVQEILGHSCDFWFKGDTEITEELRERLTEEAVSRVTCMVAEGYRFGELNYEDGEISFRGWWSI